MVHSLLLPGARDRDRRHPGLWDGRALRHQQRTQARVAEVPRRDDAPHHDRRGDLQQGGPRPRHGTPGRAVVRHLGESLVQAMEMARSDGQPEAAELVAAECVVMAETKDHQNWAHRQAHRGQRRSRANRGVAQAQEVEEQEDEHLYHTMGWARELWIQSLGLPAVLPPPEEQMNVASAMGAARAEMERKDMLRSS